MDWTFKSKTKPFNIIIQVYESQSSNQKIKAELQEALATLAFTLIIKFDTKPRENFSSPSLRL